MQNHEVGTGKTNIVLRSLDNNGGNWADAEFRTFEAYSFKNRTTERLSINSAGVVKVGSNTLITPSTDADNFVIDTGDVDSGLSILSATTGRIYFGDAASTDQGSIRYVHTDDSMRFETNSSEKLRVRSDGDVVIGTNDLESNLGSRRRLAVCDTTNGALLHLRGQSPAIFFDQSGGGTGEIYLDSVGLEVHSGTPASPGTQVFNIDSNGYRSFSTQPYVLLRKDGTTVDITADAIVGFDSTVTSEGGMTVNGSRSRITVPKAGKYAVLGAVAGTNSTVSVGDGWRLDLYRDGAVYANSYMYPINTTGASTGEEYTLQTSLIVPADANDYFEFKVASVGSARTNVRYGYFCVYYLG